MVGMTRLPIGEDDGFRAELTDHGGETQFVLAAWLNVRVRHSQSAAPLYREELGGFLSFLGASFWRATRSHLAGGKVEDSGFVSALRHLQQRAAASEFHVVRVRGDCQQIKIHCASRVLRL